MVEGSTESNLTPLTATRAYVLATNMMFQSSGGIHTIADEFVTAHHPATPETIYEITGLKGWFDLSAERGISLGAAGAPWAVRPRTLAASEFDEAQMLGSIQGN